MPEAPNIPEAAVKAGGAAVNKCGWTCQGGEDEPGQYAECEDCAKVCDNLAQAVLTAAWDALHPVVTTAEELVDTRAGLALANRLGAQPPAHLPASDYLEATYAAERMAASFIREALEGPDHD